MTVSSDFFVRSPSVLQYSGVRSDQLLRFALNPHDAMMHSPARQAVEHSYTIAYHHLLGGQFLTHHLIESRYVKRDAVVVCMLAIAYPIFQGAVQTLLPLLMVDLSFTKTTVGIIQAIPGAFVLLSGPPLARLANTRWRKATLIGCFALACMASLLYSRVSSPLGLIIPQILLGISSSAFWSNMLSTSFRLSVGQAQSRYQGIMTAMQGIGYFAGPLLGGYLAQTSFHSAFYLMAVCAVLGLASSSFLSPSRAIEPFGGLFQEWIGSYRRLFHIMTRRPAVIIGACFVFLNCFLLYVMGGSFFILYARQAGLAAFATSAIMSGRELSASVVRLSYGWVSRYIRPVVLLALATISGALMLAFLPQTNSIISILLTALGVGAAIAFLPPAVNMLSGASAAPEEQSFAIVGLNLSNFTAQTTMAPLLGLILSTHSYARVYPIIGIIWAVLALIVLLVGMRITQQKSRPGARRAQTAAL